MNYLWTKHSEEKMKFYGLSKQRIVRIIRRPERKEEAIVPDCVAVMQPINKKHSSEIWTIYVDVKKNNVNYRKIITAWRYPGKSPVRGEVPVPEEILEQLNKEVCMPGD
jgi:hypothetical protein